MKLSFSSLSFDEYSIYDMIRVCKDYGYDGIELRTGHGWAQLDLPDNELIAAKQALDDAGIVVVGLASSVNVRADFDNAIDEYTKNIRMARLLGAKGIRIMVGTYRHFCTDPLLPMDYEAAVACMQTLCDMGADYGINLFIEIHNEFCTGKVVGKLIDDISRPNCMALWDSIHTLFEGESVEETYTLLKGRISHLHMKDAICDPNPASLEYIYMPMGKGEIAIKDFVDIFEANGETDIFYSLEWEPRWKPELKVLDLNNEDVLRDYAALMKSFYA